MDTDEIERELENKFAAKDEVLSVPHVFRAESVGTARIPIRI